MNLRELANQVHAANKKWWEDLQTGEPIKRNKGEAIALIHSEISECEEGEAADLMDDKLPHRRMGEVECADAVIRIFDYITGFGYSLGFPKTIFFANVTDLIDLVSPINRKQIRNEILRRGVSFIHSGISRLLECERKNHHKHEIETALLVCLIRIAIYCEIRGYDLEGAISEKMEFNRVRKDHSVAARLAEGGKKF